MINSFSGRWAFLSNFYPCEIEYQGITYKSVEAFYVAMKVNDMQLINGKTYTADDVREMISRMPGSTTKETGAVKRFGRSLKLRKDWDDTKLKVMNYGVRQKFTKHENLKALLLSTGNEQLVEGNYWHDVFFGSCTCPKCGNNGLNHLGKILMNVRDEISRN